MFLCLFCGAISLSLSLLEVRASGAFRPLCLAHSDSMWVQRCIDLRASTLICGSASIRVDTCVCMRPREPMGASGASSPASACARVYRVTFELRSHASRARERGPASLRARALRAQEELAILRRAPSLYNVFAYGWPFKWIWAPILYVQMPGEHSRLSGVYVLHTVERWSPRWLRAGEGAMGRLLGFVECSRNRRSRRLDDHEKARENQSAGSLSSCAPPPWREE